MREEDLIYHSLQPDGRTVITTERLTIRELVRKDMFTTRLILSQCPDSSVLLDNCRDAEHIGSIIASDITDQYRFFGYGLWGVFYENKHIGLAGLCNGSESGIGRISYAVLEEFRGRGFMLEAMLSVLDFAKEQGFTEIEALISADNRQSIGFFNRLKYRYESSGGTVPLSMVTLP